MSGTGNVNWRRIADHLAERLIPHACCPTHSQAEFDPANCPFCGDIAAYEEYVRAGGTVRVSAITGKIVKIQNVQVIRDA